MAEQENTTPDPLEEAFNAPAAEGHPEAESVESPEEAAEKQNLRMRHSPQSAWTPCFACRQSSPTTRTAPPAKRSSCETS